MLSNKWMKQLLHRKINPKHTSQLIFNNNIPLHFDKNNMFEMYNAVP